MTLPQKRSAPLQDANIQAQVPKKKSKGGKRVTVKDLNEKLKIASKSELEVLLKSIFLGHPEACAVLDSFTPDSPVPEDPLTQQCFHCNSTSSLYDLHDGAKICRECNDGVFKAKTRAKLISIFRFTKAEADKMKRTAPAGAYSGYRYEWDTIFKAIKKRDGSFFAFAGKHALRRYTTPTTGTFLFLANAEAMEQREVIIQHALANSKVASLKKLVKEVAKHSPVVKNSGGILDSFVHGSST